MHYNVDCMVDLHQISNYLCISGFCEGILFCNDPLDFYAKCLLLLKFQATPSLDCSEVHIQYSFPSVSDLLIYWQ